MKKTWIYVSAGITIFILGWLLYSWWKRSKAEREYDDFQSGEATTTGSSSVLPVRGAFACKRNLTTANAQTILQYGDCGEPVKQLQQFINSLLPSASTIKVDGKFGANTESALLKATGNIRIAYTEFNPVTGY